MYTAWQATIQDQTGAIIPLAEVTVRVGGPAGSLATIYSNSTGTAKANPFFATSDGLAQFFAAPGTYYLVGALGGQTTDGWYVEITPSPYVGTPAIFPAVTGNTADASANVTAINAALAASASTGQRVVMPRGTVPINGQIVPPTNGGFAVEGLNTTFLVRANNSGGFFRSAAPATKMDGVLIDGWTFEFDTDPGTGNPYIGNGFFALFSNSQLHGLRVLNYWGDQAFIIGGDNTDMWYPEFYTDDVQGGSGGIRNVGGVRFSTHGAKGISGDDAIQVVPAESGVLIDLGANGVIYNGGTVMSRSARAFIVYNGPGLTKPVTDCGFVNVVGKVGPQYTGALSANSAIMFSSSAAAPVANCFARNCHIDETTRRATSTGNAGGFALQGNVTDGDFDVTISAPDRRVFSCDALSALTPNRNRVIVASDAAPAITSIIAVAQTAGTGNQITPRIVAPTAQQAVTISGGDRTRVLNGNIRGVQSGQIGIRVTSTPTNTTIQGNTLQGSGTSISFQAAAVAADHVAFNDLGGMAMVNIGAATQTSNRA